MSAIAAKRAELELIAGGSESGGKNKLVLPPPLPPGDLAGHLSWLTTVFGLDPAHPIARGRHEGLRGAAGHVVLERRGAPPLRFEPAARINTPARLIEDLSWQMLPSDGAVPAFKAEHCRQIAHVVRMACGANTAITDAEETFGLISAFVSGAIVVEGHTTYGTTPQRYEAALSLQRDLDDAGRAFGPPRYLIDENTGELVIRVSDLHEAGRRFIGGSLARGWVDARMENIEWTRVRLQGYALTGREGRTGPHARVDVYRGQMPGDTGEDGPAVNT